MLTCVYNKLGEMRVVSENEAAQLIEGKEWFDHPSCKIDKKSEKVLKAEIAKAQSDIDALKKQHKAEQNEVMKDEKPAKPKRVRKKVQRQPRAHAE